MLNLALSLDAKIATGGGGGAVVYDTDAQTYFTAMTAQPDATRKGHLNTMIAGLKTDGIWTKLDWLCLLASHDAQSALLNAKNVAKTLAATNAPTFTTDRGYAGDAATSYLTFGEAYGAAPNVFIQDSASLGAWCNLGSGTANCAHLGHTSATTRLTLKARADAANETFLINDATATSIMRASTVKIGHRTIVRESSLIKRGYFNGAQTADLSIASTGLPAGNATTHNHNATLFSADRLAAVYSGSALTSTEAGNIHTRLNTYLTAIGAN